MDKLELEKQFQLNLYEDEILIVTPTNRKEAFKAEINLPKGKQMRLLDKHKNPYDWIETSERGLNYYECCGVLILFGIIPPTFEELCKKLKIKIKPKFPSSEETLMGHFKADAE